MDYSKKQTELDVKKWVDSEIKNYDTCGEYSYCCNCNKSDSYPCAYAYEKYSNAIKASKALITDTSKSKTSKTLKTSTASKKPATKKTTSTCKKTSTTKKTTASKKTTAKAY